jgi:hypothetical protein
MGPAGSQGPQGPPGAGFDGGIPTSCLSPCHGFSGVVAQYQTSVHYVASVTNLGSSEYAAWTTPGAACGTCHAIDALEDRAAGNVLTVNGGVVANLASGQLEYMDPDSGAEKQAAYAGTATVAQVYCTTCHAVTNANDPHRTGIPWTPGSFPLVVAVDAGTLVLDKSPEAGTATGTDAGNYGPGDTCMWCHRSRVDIANYLTAANKITSTHWGPHEGPQADVFTGLGGYHYNYGSYAQSTHEAKLSCVDCHMADVADNSNVPDHSFNPQLAACKNCHKTATDFNVAGGEGTVQAMMTELETALNNLGLLTRASSPPYLPIDSSQLGCPQDVCSFQLDLTMPGAKLEGGLLTKDQAGALYDYILVARGGAYGIHNPIYVKQLIWDSYYALTGNPLTTLPQRP